MGKELLDVARREWVLVAIAIAYVAFRVVGFLDAEPRLFNDSESYQRQSEQPILSADFLAGGRAPVMPLLYAVVTGDDERIWTHVAIAIGCWLALAGVVAWCIRDRVVRAIGFLAVLLFSLAPEIVLWDATVLSESVSVSLTAAFVATLLWLARRPTVWACATTLAVAAAWVLIRDPHAYPLVAIAAALAIWAWLSPGEGGGRLLRMGTAAGLVALAAISVASANIYFARWVYPLQNVIQLRISADPDHLAHFQREGMPVDAELLAKMARFRETREDELEYPPGYGSPEALADVSPFHRWLRTEGRDTYTRFMLTHPNVFFGEGFEHIDAALLDPDVDDYASDRTAWDGGPPADLVYPQRALPAALMAFAAVALAAFAWWRAGPRREWWVPGGILALILPFAIFVYHGGGLEPDRHAVVPALLLRLGALLLILFAVDRLLEARRAGPRE